MMPDGPTGLSIAPWLPMIQYCCGGRKINSLCWPKVKPATKVSMSIGNFRIRTLSVETAIIWVEKQMTKSQLTRKPKTPYSDAEDDEKVRRNWNKTLGLFDKGEYSTAVLRAAISLELMTNFIIREELVYEKGLTLEFANRLLKAGQRNS